MVDTREDMLNAKHEVSSGDFKTAWHRLHNKRGRRRHDPGHLRRSVEAFDTHEHIGESGGETRAA